MVPPSQRDLNSSLKGKFLFDTPHLYFLKTPGQAGPAATLASALIRTSLRRKEGRRGVSDLPCTVFSCLGLSPPTTKQRSNCNITVFFSPHLGFFVCVLYFHSLKQPLFIELFDCSIVEPLHFWLQSTCKGKGIIVGWIWIHWKNFKLFLGGKTQRWWHLPLKRQSAMSFLLFSVWLS